MHIMLLHFGRGITEDRKRTFHFQTEHKHTLMFCLIQGLSFARGRRTKGQRPQPLIGVKNQAHVLIFDTFQF